MAKTPKAQAPGTGTEGDEEDEDQPQYVTVEQLNAAITGKFNDFTGKKLPKLLEAQFTSFQANIMEALGTRGGDEDAPAKGKNKPDPEMDRLRKEGEATKAALAKLTEERTREQATARREKGMGLLDAALQGVKVGDKLRPAVIKLLADHVTEAEDGKIVFRRPTAYGTTEDVAVDQAVKDWAKTEDGKAFITAAPVKGSGAGPAPVARVSAPVKTGDPTRDAVAQEAANIQAAKRELANAFMGVASDSE